MSPRRLALFLTIVAGCQPLPTAPVAGPAQLAAVPQLAAPGFVAPQDSQPGSPLIQSQFLGQPPTTLQDPPPVFVPVANEDYAWEQIVDVVDDYFRIEHENRVQLVGNVVTEGRIETFPQVGSTLLEPQRQDSVGRYNLFESTFQTIRRRGEIRVIPQQGGWSVDAIVYKELEDLPRPENATAGAASFRNDDALQSPLTPRVSKTRFSEYWIPQGRDCELEVQLLEEIKARLTTPVQ